MIRKSKTDQKAFGATIDVPGSIACPVKATQNWIEAGGITDGPLSPSSRLSGRAVAEVVKAYAGKVD